MGASLKVELTQTGKNETNRTATVSVVVTITSTGGTHNNWGDSTSGEGSYLTVTLDGSSIYSYYVTFGSSSTGTYTTTVYSGSASVSYGSSSTRTISANATCNTATSAGTISDSASLTLTAISSSGGNDNSGDDDEGGGNTGGGGTTTYPENTTINGQYEDQGHATIYTDNPVTIGYNDMFGTTEPTAIWFTAPEFVGRSTSIDVLINTTNSQWIEDNPVNVALCSSDENISKYYGAGAIVDDENQMETCVVTMDFERDCYFSIPTTGIKSETDYYLILWISEYSNPTNKRLSLDYADRHRINVNYTAAPESLVYIDNGSEFIEYQIFIDNGTSWDKYEAYIDNGTSWESL